MKLEWLESVDAVAKFSSFSEAAEIIPCAQSSVSRHVKQVEDELGVILFSRSSNSNVVTLTPDGERLLPLIQKLLRDYNELREFAGGKHRKKHQSVRLGLTRQMYSSASKGNLMSMLYLTFPEIHLTIKEGSSDFLLQALYSNKIDALLLPHAVSMEAEPDLPMNDDFIQYEFVGQQALSIAYGNAFAPAGRESITLKELKGLPIIFHTDIVKNYDPQNLKQSRNNHFVKACLDSGFEPVIKLVDQNLADIKQAMTVQGKGVFPSTIPPGLREYPGICYIPVKDAPFLTRYYLLSLRQNQNSGIQKLAQTLKNCF